MPVHSERRFMPYDREQLFDMIADVEKYPRFLPWCVGAKVKRRDGDVILAEMAIGFKMIRERFTSEATLTRPERLDIVYRDGPFKYLNCRWLFEPVEGGTMVDFFIDFEFRSKMLQVLIGSFFGEAVAMMVAAFERRAKSLYGASPARAGR
ncbi:MAG: type II toxin-antitoxin system RatA family toxin [Rhodospirillaceae bacterium]|nr:type II toxin-antitoxin system RatA family toxin [Rhodospirillaceae bacterium]MEA4838503.1 type II toxin-antitoxin system RatA family toxin [Rhodospirillaceae bacterium]